MKKSNYFLLAVLAFALCFSSCSDDNDPPVAEIFFEVDADDPYTINFTTTDQNVKTYSWEFGDGETSTQARPVHTYAMSGDYTVTLTVTGDGGEYIATKAVSVTASMEEMLSGGPAATKGKTWVLSRTMTAGLDGVGNVNSKFTSDVLPGANDMLDLVGLGEEYDNEYTFHHDGSYTVDNKNGNVLAGWIYCVTEAYDRIQSMTDAGIFVISDTNPANAGWSLTQKEDLVVEAANETGDDGYTETTVTFKDVNYITFSNGGFIGVKDYYNKAIVREVTSQRMVLTVFLNTVQDKPEKPSNIITVSFDAK